MKSKRKLGFALIAMCVAAMTFFIVPGCSFQSEEYVPELGDPELEPPAIGQEGTLRVGVDSNNSPLAGLSGDKLIGIDVDVAGELGDILGLKVDVRDVGTDGKSAIDNGNVDIVLGVDSDSTEKGVWISSEYIPTGIVLFALESSDKEAPKSGDKVKIGAQISSKSAWAISNSFGDDCLVSEADLATAFQALESGDVDYVASDAIVGLYAANRQNVPVKLVGVIGATSGYCIMANKDNQDLISAMSDAVTNLTEEGLMNVIERKWLNHDIELGELPKIDSKRTKTTS